MCASICSAQCLIDLDGDNYYDQACGGTDCDDTNASINPGAIEIPCDGIDNDCNPATLDGPVGLIAISQDITLELSNTGSAALFASQLDGGSSFGCGLQTQSASQTTFSCADVGNNTVTYTITDVAGNTSSSNVIVTVKDITKPIVSCLPITLFLDINGNATLLPSDIDNGSFDACGIATMLVSQSFFSCAALGPHSITLAVTDVNGNYATNHTTVVVKDTFPPIVTSLSDTIIFADLGSCIATGVTLIPPDVIDNCMIVSMVNNAPTTFFAGITHVTWVIEDQSGNSTIFIQNVTVPDPITTASISEISCFEYTAPDGTIYSNTGIYTAIIPNTHGCDSIITIDLTVNHIDLTVTQAGNQLVATEFIALYQWVDCATNYTPIIGETGQTYEPSNSGSYAVIITNNGCTDTTACTNLQVSGVDDLTQTNLILYPNPSKDGYFRVKDAGEIKSIEVIDLLGRGIQLPMDLSSGTVDGSKLDSGKYMVRVRTAHFVHLAELVIIK